MSKNIVFEGWLTKSPPSKRIWRTKWRRRWFALRQSGELPGQYFLDYYADRNCRRLKGTINLDFCEQVDAGLHMERGTHDSLDPKLRGSVFTIQTQTRTYHLEADCEADMERWVNAICSVCGLRSTDDTRNKNVYQNYEVDYDAQEHIALRVINENRRRQAANNRLANQVHCNTASGRSGLQQPLMANASTMTNEQYRGAESTGPYIPISECITGIRAKENLRISFNFDPKNIIITTKSPFENNDCDKRIYLSQPQIKITQVDISETESNLTDDECKSLNASQPKIGGFTVSKTLTKLHSTPQANEAVVVVENDGPPVPPRPPKTFVGCNKAYQESLQKPQAKVFINAGPAELPENNPQLLRVPQHSSRVNTSPSPGPSTAGYSTAGYSTASHSAAGLSIAGPSTAGPSTAGPSIAGPSTAGLSIAGPSTAGPSTAGPSTAGLSTAGPSTAGHPITIPFSAGHPPVCHNIPKSDDEFDYRIEASAGNATQYCNLTPLPPAVDRALKPRHSYKTVATVHVPATEVPKKVAKTEVVAKPANRLEYLDLDLPVSTTSDSQDHPIVVHGKSRSSDAAAYKLVDFVRTEAFNYTAKNAEASRTMQQ